MHQIYKLLYNYNYNYVDKYINLCVINIIIQKIIHIYKYNTYQLYTIILYMYSYLNSNIYL